MKNLNFTLAVLITIFSIVSVEDSKAQSVSVSFSVFQQQLSPYGRWIHNPRFGQVWVYNDASFRPYYTNGHWEYTNYGWAWVSDYDWGWAAFHYGRWEYDAFYGWMWIPGYEWAPAWVSWSSYDDYYGWAPLGFGANINISFGAIPYDRWTFIPRRNICDRDINRYYVSPWRNNNFRNAVVINNYYYGNGNVGRYFRGPERRDAERFTGNRIQERRIDYSTWGRNRQDSEAGYSNGRNNSNGRNTDRNTTNGNDRRYNNAETDNDTRNNDAIRNPRRMPKADDGDNSIGRNPRWQPGNVPADNGAGETNNLPRRKDIFNDDRNNTPFPDNQNQRQRRDIYTPQPDNNNGIPRGGDQPNRRFGNMPRNKGNDMQQQTDPPVFQQQRQPGNIRQPGQNRIDNGGRQMRPDNGGGIRENAGRGKWGRD